MAKRNISWPDGKKFAFTIVDDTDNSFIDSVKPVCELVFECGMRTTKTVWVYPPMDNFTGSGVLTQEGPQRLRPHGSGETSWYPAGGFCSGVDNANLDGYDFKDGAPLFWDFSKYWPNPAGEPPETVK